MSLAIRFWDVILSNGLMSIVAIAIGIFESFEYEIMQMTSSTEIVEFL